MNLTRSWKRHWLCGALVISLSLLSAWGQENVDPRKGRVTANPTSGNYTLEQEVELGRRGAAEVERQLTLLPADHPMSKYIASLGLRLAENAPGYRFPFTFKVVREKSVNAFALPGGPIYVHTGLIDAASEPELAGVLGHEIAHVVMRHSTRQASRQMRAQLPLAILGGALGMGVGGLAGSLAQLGISFTAGSVFMKYSRDAETEADMVGAQIIYDAGYDPQALASFFQKLKEQSGGGGGPQFLNSHPDPGNRARNIASILERFPAKQFQQNDSSEFLAAKRSLADLGATQNAVSKAQEASVTLVRLSTKDIIDSNFKTFQHATYTVDYPAKWRLNGDASSTSVTFYPEGGLGNGTLTYGTIISGFQPTTVASKELDAALPELIADIEQTNPDLRVSSNPQAFTLGGLQARRLDWVGKSAIHPLAERVRLIAFPGKSGMVLYTIFVAPDPDFNDLWPVFERILNSLRVR